MKELVLREKPLDFIHHLETIMTDSTFRSFFDEYFKTWGDTKATIMVMKAYLMIEEETKKLEKEIAPAQISQILREILINSETRKYLVESMETFMKPEHRTSFNQICHETISKYSTKLIKP